VINRNVGNLTTMYYDRRLAMREFLHAFRLSFPREESDKHASSWNLALCLFCEMEQS
jgi:hypothetical protein